MTDTNQAPAISIFSQQSDTIWRYARPENDIREGLRVTHVWGALGWHDIRQRYRRSVIGPFWFTLSMAILVLVLGFLYSTLFRQEISDYLPFLATGLIVWQYIATMANESCTVFIEAGYLIKQIRMPLTIHVARIVWRNFIILIHNLPVILVILIVFDRLPGWGILVVPVGVLILMLNGIWIGIVLGILGARYRDIKPIIGNFVQIAFFFTPIMWMPEILEDRAWVAEYNPFYHLIELIRAPLLGGSVPLQSWLWAAGMIIVGFLSAQWLLRHYRTRVPYWL